MARAQQGRVLPPDDPRRGAAGDACSCASARTPPTACARSSIPGARSSSRTTASTTTASSRPATTRADLAALAAHGIEPPYIAFASTIEPRKNVPTLVRAFARVAASRPDLRLVLAGADGWGAREARDAIAASGVATRVLRPGYLDDRRRSPRSSGRPRSSRTRRSRRASACPRSKALACGAPVVTTTGSALAEVVDDAALLVPPDDPDALADAIAPVLDDPALAARLRAAGPGARRAVHVGPVRRPTRRRVPTRREGRGPDVKALITGGGGFVGRYLPRALRGGRRRRRRRSTARGDEPVDITDRARGPRRRSRAHRPEVVYHLAALSHVGESWDDPTARAPRQRRRDRATCSTPRARPASRRVVVVGSAEEYGRVDERDLPLHEDAPLRPIDARTA